MLCALRMSVKYASHSGILLRSKASVDVPAWHIREYHARKPTAGGNTDISIMLLVPF